MGNDDDGAPRRADEPAPAGDVADSGPPPIKPTTVLQVLSLLAIAGLAIYDLRTPGDPVPAIVYGLIFGLGVGADPSVFLKGWFK